MSNLMPHPPAHPCPQDQNFSKGRHNRFRPPITATPSLVAPTPATPPVPPASNKSPKMKCPVPGWVQGPRSLAVPCSSHHCVKTPPHLTLEVKTTPPVSLPPINFLSSSNGTRNGIPGNIPVVAQEFYSQPFTPDTSYNSCISPPPVSTNHINYGNLQDQQNAQPFSLSAAPLLPNKPFRSPRATSLHSCPSQSTLPPYLPLSPPRGGKSSKRLQQRIPRQSSAPPSEEELDNSQLCDPFYRPSTPQPPKDMNLPTHLSCHPKQTTKHWILWN